MSSAASFPPFRRFLRTTIEWPARGPRAPQRGWALVSVLWIVSMLAMLAAATQALTLTSYKTERRAGDAARADADLNAAVVRATAGIADPDLNQRWRVDGIAQNFAFDGTVIRVSVQDELGRIDLNSCDGSLLIQLLQAAGQSLDDATALSDKILDWRSPSTLHRLHGATDADYAAKGYAWRQRHGPFQTVDELRLVMGMNDALFARIRPALTVYTHRPMFDQTSAPREALLALYPGDPKQVDTILNARQAGAVPASGGGPSYPTGIVNPSVSLVGRAFAITAALDLKGRHFRRDAVVEMTGDSRQPYFVLAWR
jgi:general secretion pathway protein K